MQFSRLILYLTGYLRSPTLQKKMIETHSNTNTKVVDPVSVGGIELKSYNFDKKNDDDTIHRFLLVSIMLI